MRKFAIIASLIVVSIFCIGAVIGGIDYIENPPQKKVLRCIPVDGAGQWDRYSSAGWIMQGTRPFGVDASNGQDAKACSYNLSEADAKEILH